MIFAGTNGFLDDVPVESVQSYERELYQFLETRYQAVLAAIREKKSLDDQIKADLGAALKEFMAQFVASRENSAA